MSEQSKAEEERVAAKPTTAARAWDCGLTTVYHLMNQGLVDWVPFGADKRIPWDEVRRIAAEGWEGSPRGRKRKIKQAAATVAGDVPRLRAPRDEPQKRVRGRPRKLKPEAEVPT